MEEPAYPALLEYVQRMSYLMAMGQPAASVALYLPSSTLWMVFFFQAEDGIRYLTVTGVQTCALPIYVRSGRSERGRAVRSAGDQERDFLHHSGRGCRAQPRAQARTRDALHGRPDRREDRARLGPGEPCRAACRARCRGGQARPQDRRAQQRRGEPGQAILLRAGGERTG